MQILRKLQRDEKGTVSIEYALLAGLISMGILGASSQLNSSIQSVLNDITSALMGSKSSSAPGPTGPGPVPPAADQPTPPAAMPSAASE